MADNHRELVQHFVDMINSHDVSTMSAHTAPGHIDHNPVVEDGIEANTAFWEQIFAAFPDVKVVTHDLVVEGDRIASTASSTPAPTRARSSASRPPGVRSASSRSTSGGSRTGCWPSTGTSWTWPGSSASSASTSTCGQDA